MGLTVLMYHNVSADRSDGLTIPAEKLGMQLGYLAKAGYRSLLFSELKSMHSRQQRLPRKSLVLTFDDAYRSYREHVVPLLLQYGFTATLFVPVSFVGKTNLWDGGNEPILTSEELKDISMAGHTEIGIHSFAHTSYAEMDDQAIEKDLGFCFQYLSGAGIPYIRVLAYPFGALPRKDKGRLEGMTGIFRRMGLDFALRIGNRVNPWPLRDPYQIQRIDIKGTDSYLRFRLKLIRYVAKRLP